MTSVQPNELNNFFSYVINVFEEIDIPYMVVGGFAAIFYGEPRLTIDVDIVVDMQLQHIDRFVQAFSIPDYYVSEDGVRDSLLRRYPFNVIQPKTGAKIDVVPLPADVFSQYAFRRRQKIEYDLEGGTAYFIAPEDIIIAKLIAFKETESEKHFRDARGILLLQWDTIDLDTVQRAAQGAEVDRHLAKLVETVKLELGL